MSLKKKSPKSVPLETLNLTTDYLAFISYSHADNKEEGKQWADYLHKEITDQIPHHDSNEQGLEVFLDRNDLPGSGSLAPQLVTSLNHSKKLIVICSPHSRESDYVALEISHFAKTKGKENIIPVIINGSEEREDADCGFPDILYDLFEGELPLFTDFRAERETNKEAGWTTPELYRKHLLEKYNFDHVAPSITAYQRTHHDAYIKLLISTFSISRSDIEHAISANNKRWIKRGLLIAAVVTILSIISTNLLNRYKYLYKEADEQRQIAQEEFQRAENARLLISDAHHETTELASDLVLNLDKKESSLKDSAGESPTPYQVVSELKIKALQTVNDYYDQPYLYGTPEDQKHMRSVSLNNKGRLLEKLKRYKEAEELYDEAYHLRSELRISNPTNPLYIHDLSVSCDRIGDIHSHLAKSSPQREQLLKKAAGYYREGRDHSKKLVEMSDQPPWRHSLTVSHHKLAKNWLERDDSELALGEFKLAVSEARKLVEADRKFPKWQILLAQCLYGQATTYFQRGEDESALSAFQETHQILIALPKSEFGLPGPVSQLLEDVEQDLKDVEQALKNLQ